MELTNLLGSLWGREETVKDWCEPMIVTVYKNGNGSSCEDQSGISLVSIVFRFLTFIIFRRFSSTRECCMLEGNAGFHPGWGCIDRIFTLLQIWEHRHMYRRDAFSLSNLIFVCLRSKCTSYSR